MKFTLLGFNQAAAMSLTANDNNGKELKLDITDLTILRVFTDFFNSNGMKKITDNGITYGWINYAYFLKQVPILGIQRRAFYNRLKKMVTLGVLVHHTQTNEDSTKSAYYGLGHNYNKLLGYSQEENVEEIPDPEPENDSIENTGGMYLNTQGMYSNTQGYVSEYIGGMYSNTHNSSIKDTSIKKETTTTTKAAEPSFSKTEKKAKQAAGYDEIIDAYTDNEELKTTLIEFVKMRKAIKKPLTDRALKLIAKKLDTIAQNDSEKIQILENSIVGGWQGVYALKAEDKQQAQQQQQADEMADYWNQFVVPVEG